MSSMLNMVLPGTQSRRLLKVSFVYNAELHQIPHSLPIALELAAHHPECEVTVAAASDSHLRFARNMADRYGLDAPVQYGLLHRPWDVRLRARLTGELAPMKKRTLLANAADLSSQDAIITPEWTSLILRKHRKLPRTRMIFTHHGAGDRAISFNPKIAQFDFVFAAGEKLEKRLLEQRLIRPGAYATGVYPKFDWIFRSPKESRALFDNDRPTVLYSPHFKRSLSSWPVVGRRVLDYFARSTRYNLIFAPHVRLFEPPWPWRHRAFRKYLELPHMRIDLGSERSVDMTYTLGADLFLGDVSSQVSEFIMRPRPCLFLNPRRTAWQGDPSYLFWTLGPVLEDVGALDHALEQAFESHARYEPVQRNYFNITFGRVSQHASSARRAAAVIAKYLRGHVAGAAVALDGFAPALMNPTF